jgi:photosystem II stability/assembly factor-like uncharacterized protein
MKNIASVGLLTVLMLTGCSAKPLALNGIVNTPVSAPITGRAPPFATPAPALNPAPQPSLAPAGHGDLQVRTLRLYGDSGWLHTSDALLHTADGGATWNDVSPKVGPLEGVQMSDGQNAWIFTNDILLHTQDGGVNWTMLTGAPFGRSAIASVGQNSWAMVYGDPGAGNMPVTFQVTHDGGGTWTPAAGTVPNSGIKSGLAFADAKVGWVTANSYEPGKPWVYATRDGGASWQPLTLPVNRAHQPELMSVEAPQVLSGHDVVIPVRTMKAGFMETIFYTSHDVGATWTASAALPGTGAYSFGDALHGWFWDGKALETTQDGCRTWTALQTGQALTIVEAFSFTGDKTGVAVSKGALLRTVDGGLTWKSVQVP